MSLSLPPFPSHSPHHHVDRPSIVPAPFPLPSPLQTTAPLHETFESLQLGPRPPSLPHDVLLHILAILALLDPTNRIGNLQRLARVSKEWKEAVYDELYANVVLVGRVQIERFGRDAPAERTRNLVLHCGKSQRGKQIASNLLGSSVLDRCLALRSLEVDGFPWLYPTECKELETLTIRGTRSVGAGQFSTTYAKVPTLECLTTLSIHSAVGLVPSARMFRACPNLTRLSFAGGFMPSNVLESLHALPSSARLQSLSVNPGFLGTGWRDIESVLSLPQLSSVTQIILDTTVDDEPMFRVHGMRQCCLDRREDLKEYCDRKGVTLVGGLDDRGNGEG